MYKVVILVAQFFHITRNYYYYIHTYYIFIVHSTPTVQKLFLYVANLQKNYRETFLNFKTFFFLIFLLTLKPKFNFNTQMAVNVLRTKYIMMTPL